VTFRVPPQGYGGPRSRAVTRTSQVENIQVTACGRRGGGVQPAYTFSRSGAGPYGCIMQVLGDELHSVVAGTRGGVVSDQWTVGAQWSAALIRKGSCGELGEAAAEGAARERPRERARVCAIPRLESEDPRTELGKVVGGSGGQDLALHDAEEDRLLVRPRGVDGLCTRLRFG
jgi:hypothetical protein